MCFGDMSAEFHRSSLPKKYIFSFERWEEMVTADKIIGISESEQYPGAERNSSIAQR